MRILAIETSCDETAIAVAEFHTKKKSHYIRVLSNIISSQVSIHQKYGGVVPNLAKREHQKNLPKVLIKALAQSGYTISKKYTKSHRKNNRIEQKLNKIQEVLHKNPELLKKFQKGIAFLPKPKIDTLALTIGPGLEPALWTGINFAKALAVLWDLPIVPVDHMVGHIYSAMLPKLELNKEIKLLQYSFPAITLLASGGHTELVLMKSYKNCQLIGQTLDDAAGEAFDKVARMLGLGYPGGPEIAKLADKGTVSAPLLYNKEVKIKLPRPMLNSKNYNFSFSGLKTAVLYLLRDLRHSGISISKIKPLVAKEFQEAVVEVLLKKTISAAKEYQAKSIILGGGVAANQRLTEQFRKTAFKKLPNINLYLPTPELTGDNALMIALAAFFVGSKKARSNHKLLRAKADLTI